MTAPLPGSRSEEPDEDRVVTLRRQLLSARREIADLRTQLDEVCKDRERLDWLETQDCWIGVTGEYDITPRVAAGKSYNQTVRAAIDQARGA